MNRTPPILSYTYLFVPKFPDVDRFAEQVHDEFEQLSFATGAKLIFLYESFKDLSNFQKRRFFLAENVFADKIDLEALMSTVDCYIAGNNPDEFKYLRLAHKLGIEIKSFQALGIDVFNDFPIDSNVEACKQQVKLLIEERLISKYHLNEYEYILSRFNFGETMSLFFYLKEYKKRCKKKLLIATGLPSYQDLFSNCPFADVSALVSADVIDFLSRFYPVKSLWRFNTFIRKFSTSDLNVEPLSFYQVELCLNIPWYSRNSRYEVSIPAKNMDNARKIFADLNLQPGKTIFLNPRGNTFGSWEDRSDFINAIVEKFRSAGFEIVTNGEYKIHPNVQNLFLNFWDSVAFISLCGNVISTPCGFLEATSSVISTPLNVQIIFPDCQTPWILLGLQENGNGKYRSKSEMKFYQDFFCARFGKNVDFDAYSISDENLLETIFNNLTR